MKILVLLFVLLLSFPVFAEEKPDIDLTLGSWFVIANGDVDCTETAKAGEDQQKKQARQMELAGMYFSDINLCIMGDISPLQKKGQPNAAIEEFVSHIINIKSECKKSGVIVEYEAINEKGTIFKVWNATSSG